MSTKRKRLKPKDARTGKQLCDLPRDNWSVGDYWMLLDLHELTIAHQAMGEPAQYMVRIPRRVFEAFVRAYETGSTRKLKPRA